MNVRKLTDREFFLISEILPPERKGYSEYRKKILDLFVVEEDSDGEIILGNKDEKFYDEDEKTNTFALGYVAFEGRKFYVVIYEELNNFIKVAINDVGKAEGNGLIWSYSNWQPGMKAPADSSKVREVHLVKNKLVIAIAPVHKKIWLYEKQSGVNHILPVSNFYNEIMRARGERNPAVVSHPKRIFERLDEFTDEEIGQGFLLYNEYLNKFEIDYGMFKRKKGNRFFFKKILGKQNV